MNNKLDHYPPGTYFQAPTKILTDKRMSAKSKLVLLYLLSKPKNWINQIQDVINQSTDGKRAIQSAFQELKKHGYARLVVGRGKNRKAAGTKWEVTYDPGHFIDDAVSGPSTSKTVKKTSPYLNR